MSVRGCDNGDESDEAHGAHGVVVSLQVELRNAFREWLDASRAWSDLRQGIEEKGASSTARRKLKKLEKRLNTAADALKRAQQHLNESPVGAAGVSMAQRPTIGGLVDAERPSLQAQAQYRLPGRR